MTVAIGVVCSDGVVVASDSMASAGPTARNVVKVHAVPQLGLVWTGAGSVYLMEEVETAMNELAKDNAVQAVCKEPSTAGIRKRIGAKLSAVYQSTYKGSLLSLGPQQVPHTMASDLLVAGWSRGTPWFFEFAHDGQQNWHTAAGFASVGSGGPFAEVAGALMSHYLERGPLSLDDGKLVAYRAIDTTCAVSSAAVGPPVCMALASTEDCSVLAPETLREIEVGVQRWKQLESETLEALRAPGEVKPEEPPTMKS